MSSYDELLNLSPREFGKMLAERHVQMISEAVEQWRKEHPPADDELARLRAENARLRAALAVFADSGTGWIMDDDHMRKAADALKGGE